MILKECLSLNTKDYMKIEFFGFGMSDLGFTKRKKGF